MSAGPAATPGATTPLLCVRDLTAFYGDVQALWGVSFDAYPGELVVLVGTNGAGKTTTLRTISGILRPPTGQVHLRGRPVHRLSSSQIVALGIGHVPEGRALFPNMTVRENLELGSYLPGPRKRRKENLERVFALFPRLNERQRQFAGTLSGGEQQMCAIGRGLMTEPELLMLDEPSLGLAPILVEEIFGIIRDIRRQGVTVLMSEQNVGLSLAMADRAYVLEDGRVVNSGTGDELLHHPEVRRAYLGA
jgi:branched-chain amino acid transport system ATP-binding protein